MKTILVTAVAATLGVGSAASADRGYGSRGPDRYERQRHEASVRYSQGSRNYDHTYGRYGQATYGLRTNYDRDYGRRYAAGPRYYAGRPSNFGFSVGFNSNRWGDSVSLGLGYSSGGRYGYHSGYGYRYYERPTYYYAPGVIYAPPPAYYYAPSPRVVYSQPYCAPSYYDRGGTTFYYESRSYYGR